MLFGQSGHSIYSFPLLLATAAPNLRGLQGVVLKLPVPWSSKKLNNSSNSRVFLVALRTNVAKCLLNMITRPQLSWSYRLAAHAH